MPNRLTHEVAGTGAGAAAALWYVPQEHQSFERFLEMIGGMIGGYHGGRFPDLIDPPTNPRHRSTGHCVLANATVGTFYLDSVEKVQQFLRRLSADFLEAGTRTTSEVERILLNTLSALCVLAAGYVIGFGAGVASHLVLDGFSPAGLPLFR